MMKTSLLSVAGGLLAWLTLLAPGLLPGNPAASGGMRPYAHGLVSVQLPLADRGVSAWTPARADTIEHTARGGEVLIFALPDSVLGRPVQRYNIVQAPALSWLEDRSVVWRTRRDDVGEHLLLYQAVTEDQYADTVQVLVRIQ